MAEICCGAADSPKSSQSSLSSVPGAKAAPTSCDSSSRAARRRRMEIRRFKFVPDSDFRCGTEDEKGECNNYEEGRRKKKRIRETNYETAPPNTISSATSNRDCNSAMETGGGEVKYGVVSVCGRRRDMEDAVAVHPFFLTYKQEEEEDTTSSKSHYFAVYDGHGCSHVAARCRERLHELVKEEVEMEEEGEWKRAMERSFSRMDKEVVAWNESHVVGAPANCRCDLRTPHCDAVGSTAVVAVVTPCKIVVANCGDSRAVLCRRGGKAVPLSSDHKPDRPDELKRIQAAGGRVIYWDGPRVLGVLAMSRAIGDNYLKPYVSCEPEVTVTDRTSEDDFLIIASDGLWDVVSNDTACGVARMCLRGKARVGSDQAAIVGMAENGCGSSVEAVVAPDKACLDASMLLTKLALARHSTDNVSVVVVDLRSDLRLQ